MRREVDNRNRDCEFNGPYAGRDMYITMYQDSEREFVVTHNADIKPVSYFTGRETELEELRHRIEEGRKSVLVSGMGGIGKTHICRKLFEEYTNKHAKGENIPFCHIGYIEYAGGMSRSLMRCLKYQQQENPAQNQEAAWQELEHLAADGKLLLFVDNVDKPVNADPGLQRLKGIPGAVILTSRQASFSDEFEPYPIGFLDMEQCKEIYEKIRFKGSKRKVRLKEEQDLKYVIEDLAGRHTITVELLAHLAGTKIWTVKRLRKKLEQKGFCLTFHKNGELVNIQESYEVLYDLSELTEAEQNILEAFSVFPYIPLEAKTCNEWLLADAGVSEEDDVLAGLYRKGWLQFDTEKENYSLHPVFARFIYVMCKPKMKKHYKLLKTLQKSIEMLEGESVFSSNNIRFCNIIANIVNNMKWGKDWKTNKIIRLFLKIVNKINLRREKELQSMKYIEEYISNNKKISDDKLLDVVHGFDYLGYKLESDENYELAESCYRSSLEILQKMQEMDYWEIDWEIAIIYSKIGVTFLMRDNYEEALFYRIKSYQILSHLDYEGKQEFLDNILDLVFICNLEDHFDQWLEEKMKEEE